MQENFYANLFKIAQQVLQMPASYEIWIYVNIDLGMLPDK